MDLDTPLTPFRESAAVSSPQLKASDEDGYGNDILQFDGLESDVYIGAVPLCL